MPKYDVVNWYTETVYGKCYKTVEANSEEEAIEIAHSDYSDWHFKEKGSTELDIDGDEAEAYRV